MFDKKCPKCGFCEAEQADPWREAKETLARWRDFSAEALYTDHIVPYFDHLTAENERLAKRAEELEAKDKAPWWPPMLAGCVLESGPECDGPILDPARVLATAAIIYGTKGLPLSEGMCRKDSMGAKPYRVKGQENGG